MVAWMSYLMGDLEMAERDSAAMVARLMPGQAPYPALHLYAWRALTLFTLGRWTEATALFWRCIESWHDAGSHAAGYALRGFGVGLDIGRARGDARLSGAGPQGGGGRGGRGLLNGDGAEIEAAWAMLKTLGDTFSVDHFVPRV